MERFSATACYGMPVADYNIPDNQNTSKEEGEQAATENSTIC